MINIFELEKQIDIKSKYKRLIHFIQYEDFSPMHDKKSLWTVIDENFDSWEYAKGSLDYKDYLLDLGIKNISDCPEEQILYILQFLDNMIYFISKTNKISSHNANNYNILLSSINLIVEKSNYTRVLIENKIIYTKKDADADSILSLLEKQKDIRLYLLEFNDFQIEANIPEKRKILINIFRYIELHQSEYKESNNTLFKNISFIVNNFNIRHNNDNQFSCNDEDTLSIYNTCYKMMIHLIRDKDIKNSYAVIADKYIKQ